MDTLQVTIRPLRLLFCIYPSHLDRFSAAVDICTVIWGGIGNPIAVLPSDDAEALTPWLREFDPDFIFTDEPDRLPIPIAEQYVGRVVGITVARAALANGALPNYGVATRQLLESVHKASRWKPALFDRTVWSPNPSSTVNLAWRVAFGAVPDDLRLLDPALALPRDRVVREAPLVGILDGTVPGASLRQREPLHELGSAECVWQHGHSAIIFLVNQDAIPDLAAFWNLRAAGASPILLTTSMLDSAELAYYLPRILEKSTFPGGPWVQKAPSLTDSEFSEACAKLNAVRHSPPLIIAARSHLPEFGWRAQYMSAELPAGRLVKQIDRITYKPTESQHQQLDLGTDIGWPAHPQRWAVEFVHADSLSPLAVWLTPPFSKSVLDSFQRATLCFDPDEVRVGAGGLVLTRAPGHNHVSFPTIPVSSLLRAAAKTAKFKVLELSDKGRIAQSLIEQLGGTFEVNKFRWRGLRLLCADLYGAYKAEATAEAGQVPTPTPRNRREINKLLAQQLPHLPTGYPLRNADDAVKWLLERNLLRPGLVLTCSVCRIKEWYHIAQLTEMYDCRYCSTHQRIRLEDFVDWTFMGHGLLATSNLGHGSLCALLTTLWLLRNRGFSRQVVITQSSNISVSNVQREVDLLGYIQWARSPQEFAGGFWIVAECKTRTGFTEDDGALLAECAAAIGQPTLVVLASLELPFSELKSCKQLAAALAALRRRGTFVLILDRELLEGRLPDGVVWHYGESMPKQLDNWSQQCMEAGSVVDPGDLG